MLILVALLLSLIPAAAPVNAASVSYSPFAAHCITSFALLAEGGAILPETAEASSAEAQPLDVGSDTPLASASYQLDHHGFYWAGRHRLRLATGPPSSVDTRDNQARAPPSR